MRQFEDAGVESLCLTWMENVCEIIAYCNRVKIRINGSML